MKRAQSEKSPIDSGVHYSSCMAQEYVKMRAFFCVIELTFNDRVHDIEFRVRRTQVWYCVLGTPIRRLAR